MGDRLFVRKWSYGKGKNSLRVCIQKRLYKKGSCQEHSFENIVHDCVKEIKKVSENCVLCDLDDLKDYEKVKSRLFIRLLNADKNRTILKELVHHKIGDIALVVYYLAGEKRGICSECKDQEKLCGEMGKRRGYCFRSCSNKYIFYQSTKNLSLGKNAV